MTLCGFPHFCTSESHKSQGGAFAFVLATAMAINAWQMAVFSVNTFAGAHTISSGFERMSNAEDVRVRLGDCRGVAFNFLDYGCRFTVAEPSDNAAPFYYDKLRIETVQEESGV
jgi:hypothetical protein